MLLTLLACAAPEQLPLADGETGVAVEVLDDVPEPERPVLRAPAQVALDCAAAIPTDGKADCTIALAWPDGTPAWSGAAGVGLHGRSSAGFPKPQYALELRDEAGDDAEVELFGMGAEADWLLNGMWIDRALFRNRFAYDLFRDMGEHWAPRSAYAELTLNGEYAGVYAIVERVERDAARLDYAEDAGDGARWIVKADEEGIPSTLQYAAWNPLDPAPASDAQRAAVAAELAAIEAAVAASDPSAWDRVDLDTFVDFVLLEEVVKNNDAYYLSHHLWRGDDGLVRFAPWDLDLSLGQPSYNDNENAETWIAYRPDLVALAAAQPAFARRMRTRWAAHRAGVLADDAVLARMASYRALLGEDAIARNFARWPIDQVDFGGTLYVVGSYEEEYARVTSWILARLAWMDQAVATY